MLDLGQGMCHDSSRSLFPLREKSGLKFGSELRPGGAGKILWTERVYRLLGGKIQQMPKELGGWLDGRGNREHMTECKEE